jgi:hypothetical protein
MTTHTTTNLQEMLTEYLPHDLITEEFQKHNFLWNAFEKDKSWKNGTDYVVPWEFAPNTDLNMGGLIAETDIGDLGVYKKAKKSDQPELWGAIKFHQKDLERYSDLKQSFLKILPGKITRFTEYMQQVVPCVILRGGALAIATGNGNVSGEIAVDRPQYLSLNQKIIIIDDNSAAVTGFIRAIDMNAKKIQVYSARSGGAAVDLSAMTAAAHAKVMIPGADSEQFETFEKYLLPASLGGSDTIYGVNKSLAPILQPQIVDGTSWSTSNVLDKMYDFYYDVKTLGKVKETELMVPYPIFKACAKLMQGSKRFIEGKKEAGYGFNKITLIGAEGEMTITGMVDMPNDKIFMLDKADFLYAGDKFFEKLKQQDGNEFFTVRKTTGYEHIVDIGARFDLIAKKLSSSACVHSLSLT